MTERTKQSLQSYAKRNAPLPRAEVARLVMQVAERLEPAHAAGVVHGDLKPDNVLYDPASHEVELPGFAVTATPAVGGEHQLTRGGFFMGTLLYVAPETLSGESVTAAADQYSLAAIAYFLLTARLPYLAKTPREMFHAVIATDPIPLTQARSDVQFEPPIEAVIMRGLAKQPEDRYPNVMTFAAELRQALLNAA